MNTRKHPKEETADRAVYRLQELALVALQVPKTLEERERHQAALRALHARHDAERELELKEIEEHLKALRERAV